MKKVTLINLLLIFVMIPATLWLGTQLTGRWYYLTSTLIIIETMLPFFLAFETEQSEIAAAWCCKSAYHFQESCFTCTVSSDKSVNVTLTDIYTDLVCGILLTVGLGKSACG